MSGNEDEIEATGEHGIGPRLRALAGLPFVWHDVFRTRKGQIARSTSIIQ